MTIIMTGVIQPLLSVLLGGVTNAFIEYGTILMQQQYGLIDAAQLQLARDRVEQAVMRNIYLFIGIGAGALVAAYLLQALWIVAGQRQARRVRQKFLQAILNQDVAFFDDNEVGDLTTRLSR